MDHCLDNLYLQQSPPSLFDSSMGKKTDYPHTWSVMTDASIQEESMSSSVYSPYQESLPDQEQTQLADIQTSIVAPPNPQQHHDGQFPLNVTSTIAPFNPQEPQHVQYPPNVSGQQDGQASDVPMLDVMNETSIPNGQHLQTTSMSIAFSNLQLAAPTTVVREDPTTEKELQIDSIKSFLKTAEQEIQQQKHLNTAVPEEATAGQNQSGIMCSQSSPGKYQPSSASAAEGKPIQEESHNSQEVPYTGCFPNEAESECLWKEIMSAKSILQNEVHSMPNQPVSRTCIIEHSGPDEQPVTSFDPSFFTEGCGQQPLQQTNSDIAYEMPPSDTHAVHSLDSTLNWKHIPHHSNDMQSEKPVNTSGAFIKIEQADVQQQFSAPQQGVKQRRKRKGGLGEEELQVEIYNKKQKDLKRLQSAVPGQTEKKERRKQQNRDAAARCREKKKKGSEALLKAQEELEEMNQRKEEEIQNLRQQLADMQAFMNHHVPVCGTESADVAAKWSTLMTGAARMKD